MKQMPHRRVELRMDQRRDVTLFILLYIVTLLCCSVYSFPTNNNDRLQRRLGETISERNVSTSWVVFPRGTESPLSTTSRMFEIERRRINGTTSTSSIIITRRSRVSSTTTTTSPTTITSSASGTTNMVPVVFEKDDEVYTTSSNFSFSNNRDINNNREQPTFYTFTISSPSTIEIRNRTLAPSIGSNGIPDCASGSAGATFCESVSGYPPIDLKKEVKLSTSEFREFFGQTSIDGRKSYMDDDSTEERVCRRIPKIIYPQTAKNQANQWVYIVNDIEYTQAVVAEVCEKEDKPCSYLDDNLPPGMYSRCRQKYSFKKLLAVHPTEKRTYTDTFQFPSCCACYIKIPSGFDIRRTLSSNFS